MVVGYLTRPAEKLKLSVDRQVTPSFFYLSNTAHIVHLPVDIDKVIFDISYKSLKTKDLPPIKTASPEISCVE
jgi:hypothetical protein